LRISTLVLKELWHRKGSALVILAGVTLSVAAIATFQLVSLGSIDEARRAMLTMGKNIVILPRGVELDDYWAADFGDRTLPQDDVKKVAHYCIWGSKPKILARHFLGSLQRTIEIDGAEVILSGIMVEIDRKAPKVVTAGAQKPLKEGEAELGSRAAERLGVDEPGETFTIEEGDRPRTFTVTKIKPETGTFEDFKVLVNLDTVQEMFGTGDVVNVIEAVSCMCSPQSLPALSKKIERNVFAGGEDEPPRARAYHFMAIAGPRFEARTEVMQNSILLSLFAFVFGLMVIGGYSVWDARERRQEAGILLAIAALPRHVAWLFLLKMILIAAAGGLLGCLLGDLVVRSFASTVITAMHPSMRAYPFKVFGPIRYAAAVGLALVLTLIPSLVGVLIASRTDPAETLREL
jgi:putative ABC transport system permease protein